MATRYKPHAALDVRSAALFAGIVVVAAAGAALAAHFIARSMALVLVLPAVQGLFVGAAAMWTVRRARLQRPGYLGALAAVAAASAVVGHGVLDYFNERAAHRDDCAQIRDVKEAIGVDSDDGLDRDYRACLAELSPQTFAARRFRLEGDPRGTSRSGLAVGALELLIAMGVAGLLAATAAREPACPRCRRWRVETALGTAAIGASGALVDALLRGDPDDAASRLAPPDTREATELALLACPEGHDAGGGVLRVSETRLDRRRRLHRVRVADLVVSRDEVAPIREKLA